MKGYFLTGQNPAGGGPNAGLHRAGLRKLDWLVVLDWFETESAVFWKNDPKAPPSSEIETEVFFFPAAAAPEKEGSLTNTQRLIQWHNKAIDPSGDRRSDAWIIYNLGKRLKQLYAGSTDPKDRRCSISPGTTTSTNSRACPMARSAASKGNRTWRRFSWRSTVTGSNEIDPRTGRPVWSEASPS